MERVAVIGLGYVGFPLLCLIAEKGYKPLGLDISNEKIKLIKSGKSPIDDEYAIQIIPSIKDKMTVTTMDNADELKNTDIIIICVPTPVDSYFKPDYTALVNTSKVIASRLQKNQIVVIESTINPGTTEEIVLPELLKSGLEYNKDFYLAHCPERIDPGNKNWNIRNIPRVCGASDKKALSRITSFYHSVIEAEIIPLTDIKTAEATKIMENSFRDINIAFVNELAKSFDILGIDLLEVIKGASSKPFSFMPHYPGAGVGGHCIPVDPYYLISRAESAGFDHVFLKRAREINNSMPDYVIRKFLNLAVKTECNATNTKIGILGLTFKPNIADTRNSPSFKIIDKFKELGFVVRVYDPQVKYHADITMMDSIDKLLEECKIIVIVTAHEEFKRISVGDYASKSVRIIVDGRNLYDPTDFKGTQILFTGIGRGF